MAGIGSMVGGERQAEAGAAPATAARSQEADEGEQPNVSPEEQAEYDGFLANALKILYPEGEKGGISPAVLNALKGGDNPMMTLATTAVSLITSMRENAKRAGHQVPDEVLYHAGLELVEELGEIAGAAGIHTYSDHDLEQAWYLALDLYRTSGEQSGDVDPEQLKQGFAEIQQADQQGHLGQVLPGIEGRLKERG